jgi:signal transduction histidine kinase/signal recognition particle receptor subunit beta
MAQWNHADRIVHAKVVYYGPAFGGKTSNLEALHRITDPAGDHKLLSIKTANDRTLFFDLLPFDLGDILGYQVAMKLYTVPGQVRYDTTRQVVLSGTDALVFVADSSASRREQNVWSLQNLQMNMRAKGLDPKRVPVLFQFNKQDVPDAVPAQQVARWLGIPTERGFPAVAIEGRGVLETFVAACRAMMDKLVSAAETPTRNRIDPAELAAQIDRAFAPYLARADRHRGSPPGSVAAVPQDDAQVVLDSAHLLERSIETSVELGEQLTTELARARRLEQEAEAFRRLSESLQSVGASFERDRIVDAALEAVAQVLAAPVVTLVGDDTHRQPRLERSHGRDHEPLLQFEAGRALVERLRASGAACVVDELVAEFGDSTAAVHLAGLRAAAGIPVDPSSGRILIAYAPQPDGSFDRADVRFLATVAGHLAVGLEKVRLHGELERHRDRLEGTVAARTEQLREAYESLRRTDLVKDRFLGNLSHEMKTPLTAILSASHVIRDYDSKPKERRELAASIISSAQTLERHLDDLLRLANLRDDVKPLDLQEVAPERLAEEAIGLAGHPGIQYRVVDLPARARLDLQRLARATANLIDNAVKFSPPSAVVKLVLQGRTAGGATPDALVVSVLDRGCGVPEADRERIFAPFEQGGDPLTGKPPGMGIGLHEARAMARRHGGTLEHLPRQGGGSEFRMTIPLEPQREPAAAEESLV